MNLDLLEAEVYDNVTKCLKLKAFTAVISDDKVSADRNGADEYIIWKSTTTVIFWDVKFVNRGQLDIAMNLGNNEDNVGFEIEIDVNGEKIVTVPQFTGGLDEHTTFKIGSITVEEPGCHSVKMQAKYLKGEQVGNFWFLELSGPAAVDSAEDMLPRCADDVHLIWNPQGVYDILYCAMTPTESHMGTQFTPFHIDHAYVNLLDTNYEGNQSTYYRFSSDDEATFEDIYKATDLKEDDSGFIYPWDLNETYHFLIKVVPLPDKNALLYFGYVYLNDAASWKLLTACKRLNHTTLIDEFTSIVRSQYGIQMGYFPREAAFGPVWGRLPTGEWKEVTRCDFSKFGTLFNANAFVKDNRVHLRTGGRTIQTNKLGTVFNLQPSENLPEILQDIDSNLENISPK